MKDVSAVTFALQAFVTLIVILDPPGNAPIFLAVLGERGAKVGRQLAIQAAFISLLIIASFALFGVGYSPCRHIGLSSNDDVYWY